MGSERERRGKEKAGDSQHRSPAPRGTMTHRVCAECGEEFACPASFRGKVPKCSNCKFGQTFNHPPDRWLGRGMGGGTDRPPDDYPRDSGWDWERDQQERARRERPPSPRHNRPEPRVPNDYPNDRDQKERARRQRPPSPQHNRGREMEQEDRVGREHQWREREDRLREMENERVRREREDRERDRNRDGGTRAHREGDTGRRGTPPSTAWTAPPDETVPGGIFCFCLSFFNHFTHYL